MSPGAAMETLARAPCLLLMLDYDGTLSPIAPTPGEASLLPGTVELLERLSRLPNTMVAVISGRAIADLSERVACEGILLYGNHGLECRGLPVRLPVPMAELVERAEHLREDLVAALAGFEGVLIEDKGPVISVHYRRADPRRVVEILNRVRRTARAHDGFKIVKGKRVVELRPNLPIDKGTAVRELIVEARKRWDCEPTSLYAGDDTTDEDAFAAVTNGVSILVGEERASKATHHIPNPQKMARFLEDLEIERNAWFSRALLLRAASESLK